MPTTKKQSFRSTLRYLATGVGPLEDKTDANGALDAPGTPPVPISTDLPQSLLPWIDGLEDPEASTGLLSSPDPSLPEPDIGKSPIVGAYEGAVRSEGPTSYFPGYEVSGGPWGDQALGRRMLFKIPLVMAGQDAAFEGKVQDTNWQDELAAAIMHNGQGEITNEEVTNRLLLWEGEPG